MRKVVIQRVVMAVLLLVSRGAVAENFVLQSYLSFTHSLSRAISQQYTESAGLTLDSVMVDYQGQPVSYQYQMWRLKPNSVCLPLKDIDVLQYSQCSMAAQQLFKETCRQFINNPNRKDWLYPKYKRLYCNAAASFQPVVAQVRLSLPVEENTVKKQQCSLLVLKAMSSRDPLDIQLRDEACQ
ncbi:hypothetical protein [Neptunomonas japonica]|uniref:hypothetical protein n=1 Tax=Neptunomonas japonica TaxID=417574 RepID=UPI0004119344|nr:hypothetical protein [Neptunomonas japonica]